MLATEQIAKLTAAKGGPRPFDVAILDEGPALDAIDAGLIAKYDPAKSPAFAELLPQFQGAYGPAVTMQAIGIAYNPKTVKTPPTSWEDLWKPEYKGRVGITSLASTLGLAFLLDINRLAGGNENDMAPGFKPSCTPCCRTSRPCRPISAPMARCSSRARSTSACRTSTSPRS